MTGSGGTRPDMVEAARNFMLTPKVRETSFEEQKQFLMGKGVTESEIAEARASIPPEALASSRDVKPSAYTGASIKEQNGLLVFAKSALVIGSLSYAGYCFLRSFILPKFFDIPDPSTEEVRQLQAQVNELQNSIKFVMDSVSQTTQTLATQQQEISRALLSISTRDTDLSRVEAGISTIKSLLLSHNNFAPIVTPTVTTLPSWQQAGSPHCLSSANSGYITPLPNLNNSQKDLEADETKLLTS